MKKELKIEYQENTFVLAFHGPLIYSAKILKILKGKYFIHYQNWSKKWDEWVDESRLMIDNEENRAKMKQLIEDQAKKPAVKNVSNIKKKRKHIVETAEIEKEDVIVEREISLKDETEKVNRKRLKYNIPISDLLKRQLVKDWNFMVEKPCQLVPLPRRPSVNQILQQYIEAKTRANPERKTDILKRRNEFVEGLKTSFTKTLPSLLLYRFERNQYDKYFQTHPEETICDVYGAEHLLRFFVRLPLLLQSCSCDLQDALDSFSHFLKFLERYHDKFFLQEYENQIGNETQENKLNNDAKVEKKVKN